MRDATRAETDVGGGRVRSRARRAALVLAALAFIVAGCGRQAEEDPQLTVYLSVPLSGPRAQDGRDVADAAQLALEDAGAEAGGTAIALEALDDAIEGGWDAAVSGANARLATQDSTAIAYIGELDSGASRTSVPITNEAGMLQVSPGSGAEDLTRDALGSSGIPSVQPSGARTFGRVVPSDRAQGEAAGVWMSELGITSVAILGANSDFGAALTAGLESASPGPAIVQPGAKPEAAFDAQDDPFSDTEPGLVSPSPGPLFASDALLDRGDLSSLRILRRSCKSGRDCPTGGPRDIRLTSAALDPTQLPPAADDFQAAFRETYGREPGRYAAYGYEAMGVVLDSIDRADDPLDRRGVVDAFFATQERDSIVGTYSIDAVGNTTLARLGAYDVDDRSRVVPSRDALELP